jgi:NAD(P)-dependent dehydrogenase (short-subunit alcohol dehydrogenase family)
MSKSLKIALVTGGSRGLGKNTALKLAERGNDVILTYRSSRTEAEAVVKEILSLGRRAVALPLDVEIARPFQTSPSKCAMP